MIDTQEMDAFIGRSLDAIATTVRRDGSPASSMIGYARVGNSLYFSTAADGVKRRTLARDPRLTLCVINANEPSSFVSVEGTVTIHHDNLRELREPMYACWDALIETHPNTSWAAAGDGRRELTEGLLTEAGWSVYEPRPTRASGMVV